MRRDILKSLLPKPIRRFLGVLRSVANRLLVWRHVANKISGESRLDQAILRRAIRRSVLTVWRDLDRWQFPMVDQDCRVISKGVGRFHVRSHSDDLFHVLPGQEKNVERVVRAALRPGDTFVDAGSNIGYYTILASKLVGDRGRVFACEMMPLTAAALRAHVELNSARNVIICEGALSHVEGQVVAASHPAGKFGQASIVRSEGGQGVAVTTLTLESLLQDMPAVRLIKMDLEGAELGALRGLGSAIDKVQVIIFENRGAPEVVQWLDERQYLVTRIDGNNALATRSGIDASIWL